MNPGDFLAAYVQQYVTTLVSPELVKPVTEATGQAMALILNDPAFVSQLRAVIQLREENQWLRSQVNHLQTVVMTLSASASGTTSPPRKRSGTSSKASASRTPTSSPRSRNVRVGGTASRQSKSAFLKGVRQAKR